MGQNDTFSNIDYAIFLSMVFISALIGFYFAWKDRKKQSVSEYFLGNRKLKIFPVGMSQLASFTSAVSLLGFSHEMYRYGSMYWLIGVSYFITQPFATHVYLPFFHRLKLTSVYEYLEYRFDRKVRVLASIIFCIQIIFYMSIVLYAPSLTIHQVTGLSLWISIFLTGIICTIYTSLGGIKAVVWTDSFQVFVMFIGLFAIIYEGLKQVGGINIVYKRAYESGRIEFFDFDVSPLKRHTFWSIMVGGFFTSLTVYGSNQATIQRYLALPTVKDAIISMYLNLFGTFAILSVCCICGFIAYAYYFACDPLLIGRINKYDQILPLLVIDLLSAIPGLSGLFIASVYAACLSTISSGLNSFATVCLRDFIQPFYYHKHNLMMNEVLSTRISILIAGIAGLFTIGLSFLCKYVGSTVVQIAQSIFGIVGGPLLGVISLGMFFPCANSKGALCGLVFSLIVNFTLSILSVVFGKSSPSKPFTTIGCNSTFNISILTNLSIISPSNKTVNSNLTFIDSIQISYLWYSALAVLNVIVIGNIVSCITGFTDVERLNSRLYINVLKCIKSRREKSSVNETPYQLANTNENKEQTVIYHD